MRLVTVVLCAQTFTRGNTSACCGVYVMDRCKLPTQQLSTEPDIKSVCNMYTHMLIQGVRGVTNHTDYCAAGNVCKELDFAVLLGIRKY